MNEQSAEALARALDELHAQVGPFGIEWNALKRRLIEAMKDFELVDRRYCTVIDRRLLERMPVGATSPYAAVCPDGSGYICNGYEPFRGTGELCSFGGPGYDASTAAMQAWLNEHEKPAWGWPVPTDADRGKLVYFSDTQSWCGPRPLLGVVDGEFPFVAGRVAPRGWRYAVLADPDNPDAPPADIVQKLMATD